jgi:hypothetical protein
METGDEVAAGKSIYVGWLVHPGGELSTGVI